MRAKYKSRILFSFISAALLLAAVGLSVYKSFGEMERQKGWVDHTYQVIGAVSDVLSGMKDVQSSQRGFLITGDEGYLDPYNDALPDVKARMVDLKRLVADNPEQAARFQALSEHIDKRMEIAANVLKTYRQNGQQAAFALVKDGSGKKEMDHIRDICGDMIGDEQTLLQKRQVALKVSSQVTLTAGLLGLVTCFFILVLVFYMISREASQRAFTEENLKTALARMETITQETQMMGRLGDYLRGCRSEEEAYDIIGQNMPQLFPGTHGRVSMFNNSRNLLLGVATWGDVPVDAGGEFDPDDCWALRQGRIHQSMNDGKVPMCDHLSGIKEVCSSVCLPMQAQGETLGQMYIGSAIKTPMDDRQIATMRNVGEQVSLALANLKLQKALKEQSVKDPLTKLFNRRYLEETLVRETARAQRNGQTVSALIMDIDHFKKVNDTYGHDGGDAVLVAFAALLGTKARKEDIACRLGGEEFVLILPSADMDLARDRAQEICDATRNIKVKFQGSTIAITVSIGVAVYPVQAAQADDLIPFADLALYSAKNTGRNRVVVYDPAMDKKA